MDVLSALATSLPTTALAAVSAGLLRNIAGWLENALKDGKIESYEWKQLIGTFVKYFSAITLLSLGLPVGEAVATTFGLDVVTSALKNKR